MKITFYDVRNDVPMFCAQHMHHPKDGRSSFHFVMYKTMGLSSFIQTKYFPCIQKQHTSIRAVPCRAVPYCAVCMLGSIYTYTHRVRCLHFISAIRRMQNISHLQMKENRRSSERIDSIIEYEISLKAINHRENVLL